MKKHGWVIQEDGNGGFVGDDYDGKHPIKEAKVFSTRKQARESNKKLDTDVVRKVKLGTNNKPIRVIPGRSCGSIICVVH